MSILIKGMEMPKKGSIEIRIYSDGRVINDPIYACKRVVGRAVHIPPHGDLIDRDALENKHHWTDNFYETEYVEVEDIDAAPTIIPADPAEEGE